MNEIIIKGMSFCSAHHLPAHMRPQCRNLHGHTFAVRVDLAGSLRDEFGNVAFYSETRGMLDGLLFAMDHKVILPAGSFRKVEGDLVEFYLSDGGETNRCVLPEKTVFALERPFATIEFIADYLAENLREGLKWNSHLERIAVHVAETETYSAVVTKHMKG